MGLPKVPVEFQEDQFFWLEVEVSENLAGTEKIQVRTQQGFRAAYIG